MKKWIMAVLFTAPALVFASLGYAQSDHGASLKLGSLKIVDQEFTVTRLGELAPGKEAAFEVTSTTAGAALASLSLYLWLEDEAGAQVSAPAKGGAEGKGLHFHATPKAGSSPVHITLRLRKDGKDEKASLPLSGHGHEHVGTPHDGVVSALKDQAGVKIGFVELKLHDDKGDLELWLGKDNKFTEPLDLPLDAGISVKLIDKQAKVVALTPRDLTKNEDEDGKSNLRGGKTNYFIFPGTTGQDASWLKGSDFQSVTEVTVVTEGKTLTSEEFMLVPHTHAPDGGHKH